MLEKKKYKFRQALIVGLVCIHITNSSGLFQRLHTFKNNTVVIPLVLQVSSIAFFINSSFRHGPR